MQHSRTFINVGTLLLPIKMKINKQSVIIGGHDFKTITLTRHTINRMIVQLHLLKNITNIKLINCDVKGSLLARLIREASLKEVILESCLFNDETAVLLAYFMTSSSSLKKLDIAACDIGDLGVLALLMAFEGQRYKEISLIQNHRITRIGYEALQQYHDRMQSFQLMHHLPTKPLCLVEHNQPMLPLDARKMLQVCLDASLQQHS